MSINLVIAKLTRQVDEAGGIRAWCRNTTYQRWNESRQEWEPAGFSASFISDVLAGKIEPSKNLLRLLGFEAVRQVRYRPITPVAPPPSAEAA